MQGSVHASVNFLIPYISYYPVGFIQVGITALANLTAAAGQLQYHQGSPPPVFDVEDEVDL